MKKLTKPGFLSVYFSGWVGFENAGVLSTTTHAHDLDLVYQDVTVR